MNDIIKNNVEFLEGMLNPLLPYYEKIGEFGDFESGQGKDVAWFEMFARSTYGIIAYTSVVGNNKFLVKFNEIIHLLIQDNRYKVWYNHDQKAVELIPLIVLMVIHKSLTWDTYSKKEKEEILSYFGNINKILIGGDNWQFFRIIVTRAINELGGNEDYQLINDSWKVVNECYCGDGWYRDGKNGVKDYYVAFGYHFYSLLYRFLFPEDDKCEIIKERALLFLNDYRLLFDTKGRMIAYGRSMIYRFASLSFWSMLLCNHILNEDETCFVINIISKGLEWWKKQKITNREGLLTLGFAYKNEYICENYNSSGSPYWVMKAFLFMLQPIINIENYKTNTASQGKNFSIKKIANGDIWVVPNSNWSTMYVNSYSGVNYVSNNSAKYMRFAYNSRTGFNLSKNYNEFLYLSDDNSLVFDICGVKHLREANKKYQTHDRYQEFQWSCGDLIGVRTYIIPQVDGYIRIHIIDSKLSVDCYETGFAIESSKKLVSGMCLLYGVGSVIEIENAVNSNILYPHTMMSCIKYHINKGINMIADYTYLLDNTNDSDNIYCPEVRLQNKYIVIKEIKELKIRLSKKDILSIRLNVIKNLVRSSYSHIISRSIYLYNNTKWIKKIYRTIKHKLHKK